MEKEESSIKNCPNPMGDKAQIMFDNAYGKTFTVCLYDLSGKLVLRKAGIQDNVVEIDRGNLRAVPTWWN